MAENSPIVSEELYQYSVWCGVGVDPWAGGGGAD